MLASGIGAFCIHSFKIMSHYWRFKKIILSETPCSHMFRVSAQPTRPTAAESLIVCLSTPIAAAAASVMIILRIWC